MSQLDPTATLEVTSNERTAITGPIMALLRSTRFWVAVAGLVVAILVAKFPELQAFHTELMTFVLVVTLTLIGGYSVKDATQYAKDPANLQQVSINQGLKNVVDATLPGDASVNLSVNTSESAGPPGTMRVSGPR